ncbi:MAG: Crp/Fnr family transcriptional regulator [Cytophagia bacterium]|nr:Crp/Fnr family transcriptional regulator [Cytophagia bacterium]
MFDSIFKSVRTIADFTQAELDLFSNSIEVKEIHKGDFLLSEGEISNALYFINQGALRRFKNIDGYNERTLDLYIEGDWAFDHPSFMKQAKTENNIEACEDSTVLSLSVEPLHSLIQKAPRFFSLGRILDNSKREEKLDLNSPESLYKDLLENKPEYLQRFPLKHIASYLGVTPETLSRVRAKIKA